MTGFRLHSGETWRNCFDDYAQLRTHSPVHHVEDGDYWVLSRFADVANAARDTATYSSAGGLTVQASRGEADLMRDFDPMVMQDPPRHTAFRRLVSRGFTPRQVASLEPEIRAFVKERVARVVAKGRCDIVAELFKPLPSMVVAHYLGVPQQDRAAFDDWTDAIVASTAGGDVLASADAATAMMAYFTELIERRRTDPGDDTISHLVRAAGADEAVSVLQMLGFAFTMVAGGNDTTTGLLGGTLELLTSHRDQQARLVADRSLVPDAIEECLRLTSPVQGLARTTTRNVDVGAVVIPAGRRVLLLYGAANRDPAEFGADADELRIDRRPSRSLTFSVGAHHCLGAAAARLAARVALEELLDQCPGFSVEARSGRFAPGHYVRRYATLPFTAGE